MRRAGGRATSIVFLGALLASMTASVLEPLLTYFWKNPPTLQDRIQDLTGSLNDAAEVIGSIETEIEARRSLVADLERKAQAAEALSEVNKEAFDAAAQVLRGEIERNEREGAWWDVAKNVFYIVLGIVLTKVFEWAWARWRK